MIKKTNPPTADDSELELGSEPGEEDVEKPEEGLEAANLSELERITGRKFKDLADFEKHYKELSSFVGQNPKELKEKAEAFDRMIEDANKIIDEAEASGELEALETVKTPSEIEELRREVQEVSLLKAYPEAEKILPTIHKVAEAEGISLKEAYEFHLKDLLASKLELEKLKEQEKSISVESKQRISSSKARVVDDLIRRVVEEGTDEAKEALVKEVFSE